MMVLASHQRLLGILVLVLLSILLLSLFLVLNITSLYNEGLIHGHSARHILAQRMLGREHTFICASDEGFLYAGRWLVSADQSRRDTSVPGATVDFTFTNSTSLLLSLRNGRLTKDSAHEIQRSEHVQHTTIASRRPDLLLAPNISLLVVLEGQHALYFSHTGRGTLRIASDLNKTATYAARITILGSGAGMTASTLELEGIWLSKGGYLLPAEPSQQRPVIEFISALSYASPKDTISSFPTLLALELNTSYSIVPVADACLTDICSLGTPSVQDVYFRTGQPGLSRYRLPHRHTEPAALLMDIGAIDFHHFLQANSAEDGIDQFVDGFVKSYVKVVRTIRSATHEYQSVFAEHTQNGVDLDASYAYNSAPILLPIFLLTPFTPTGRLQRLLGRAISDVVRTLRNQGDLATTWIDTDGWLAEADFTRDSTADQGTRRLAESGHLKVASHISAHICPSVKGKCPFQKHDTYQGQLYVPDEAGLGKMLEERKVMLIKQAIGLS